MAVETPLLDTVKFPADLRKLERSQLRQLADELRAEMIDVVSVTGGHLGSGLGVVELTTAIHYVFDTPDDRLVWDVGHQCYPHKILTGRRDRIRTLRQGGGLSGFTKRTESEYDPFGAAHAATSISAATGFAEASRHLKKNTTSIAVIGDGSMSGGMAYEGLNNAGHLGSKAHAAGETSEKASNAYAASGTAQPLCSSPLCSSAQRGSRRAPTLATA